MTCKSQNFFGTHEVDKPFENWNGDVVFRAGEYWEPAHDSATEPTGLGHLVFAVAKAAEQGQRLTTVGSAWAFEDMVQTDGWLISLKNLDRRLAYVTGERPDGADGLTDEWRGQLADPSGRRLFHVEAGIELGALNELLNTASGEPLALPVLGGANGQSLAGAVSTSTHGGDWRQPPLPDLVRALHLVTDGGHEVWIERASEPITVDDRLRPLLPCPETRIVRDDEVFNAALVSFGRFGVIYSVVLEVRTAFNVAEIVTLAGRDAVLTALQDGILAARPLDPLLDLLAAAPLAPTLAVKDEAVGDPYFCQLVFNSQDTSACWAQRRWLTADTRPLNVPTDPSAFFPIGAGIAIAALNLGWAVGMDVGGLIGGAMGATFRDAMTPGRRGPHHLLTSGTRATSQRIPYRADSIEVVFAADDQNFVPFLKSVLFEAANYQQAGYISVRPSLASRATMSMHNVPSPQAYSIEVSTLKTVPQARQWMHFVHYQALAHRGRPHWGQYNKLDQPWVASLYGKNLRRWHHALWTLTGASDRFSSGFSRKRGLDPENVRRVASVFRTAGGALTHLVGADGAPWSPVSVRDAITGIRDGSASYAVDSGEGFSFIVAVENPAAGGAYLRTEADEAASDNLASLPPAPGPSPTVTDDAVFSSLACPHGIPAGETATALVTMANSGTSVWERGQVFLAPTAASGIRFSPVPLSQATTAFQKAVFAIPVPAGPAGTKSTLVGRLMKEGLPFGPRTEVFTVVFTEPGEPAECGSILDQIAALEAEIETLTADLDPHGDPGEQARIRRRIIELNGSLARLRARGAQLGCTLP